MLTLEQARKIVSERLANSNFSDIDSLIILDDFTIEKPYAWIFSYTSKLWHETKDTKYLIAGNSPIIIDKQTGNQTSYPSGYNLEEIIEQYEEEQNIWNLVLFESNRNNQKILLLKNKMNLSYNDLINIKKNNFFCIEKGSELRLTSLQTELLNIGIKAELRLSPERN
nr:YrhB domain-containing protein [uncultured Flavobacterium sp.]